MEIRQEQPEDFPAIYELVQAAFLTAEQADGTEQDLVVSLRHTAQYVPKLALVAEKEGRIIGYGLWTKISLGGKEELALAPLAVSPEEQNKGVGQSLMAEGHRRAKEMGYDCVVVLGNPAYYAKAGFLPASSFGIRLPFPVPEEYGMILPLGNGEIPQGMVTYAPPLMGER